MRRLRAILIRLLNSVSGRRAHEFDDELASHLQLHIDDNVRSGMSPVEARRTALLAFGSVQAIREAHHDRRRMPSLATLGQDVRDAYRFWRRNRLLFLIAALSLTLGIGANTAIFSIVNGLILRPLPVREPGRLVQVQPSAGRWSFSNPLWEAIRDRRELFDSSATWYTTSFNLSDTGETQPVRGLMVSGSFFDLFGVQPSSGRLLHVADDDRASRRVADAAAIVISHGFWQRQFAGSAAVVGQTLHLDGVAFTVVGVTPPAFFGAEVGRTFDVAMPLSAEPLIHTSSWLDKAGNRWLKVMARLRPDQTIEAATSALTVVQPQLREATLEPGLRPADAASYLRAPMALSPATTGVSDLRDAYGRALTVVMAVVGLILLIACTNLANLLLARADSRRHEMTVRLALGASRARLIRQVLLESLVIAAAGATLAVGFAAWASRLLVLQISRNPALDLSIDWTVLAFTSSAAVVATLVFGVAPAWQATADAPRDAVRAPDRTASRRGWFATALVAAQVALSLVLLVGAGLFIRTFTALASMPLGFDANALLVVGLDTRKSAVPPSAQLDLVTRVRDTVAALPGVAGVGLSVLTPLAGGWDWLIDNPAGLNLPETERSVYVNAVSPEWFRTYGMTLRAGRTLTADDARPGMPPVIVVNEALEGKYFSGRTAIGQTLRQTPRGGPLVPKPMTIVGIVNDAVYEFLKNGAPPTMYRPLDNQSGATPSLTVRAAIGPPAALGPAIVAATASVDPRISLTIRPLADRVESSVSRERLMAMLAGFFGGLALLLAALGLYGVVSYAVSQRRREIGIRIALGAAAGRVVAVTAGRVGVTVGIGLVAGSVISLWASQFVAALLFGLQPRDFSTLAAAVATLAAVAGVASWLPARRAARLDPTIVLRD